MKVSKTKAQAFLDGLHKILDEGGFKGCYYWDVGGSSPLARDVAGLAVNAINHIDGPGDLMFAREEVTDG